MFLLFVLRYKNPDCFLSCTYEIHVDEANKVVTAPAFMYQNETQGWNSLHLIHDGIGKMITAAINLAK